MTARQLEQEVWSGLVVDRGTINKRVLLVRNALREAGCEDNYITVVRGTGYRLSVPVERLADCVDCADLPVAEAPDSGITGRTGLWRTAGAAAILLAALVVSFAFKDYGNGNGLAATAGLVSQQPAESFSANDAGRPSLAVLPFNDLGKEQADAYLGDGLAREVINLLGASRGLDIASSTSSFAFRDPEEPVASIGAQLGVDTVLRGSVERFGDRIHVLTRLLNTENGEQLWSASYGGTLDEVFSIQDEIASNVAMALQVPFGPDGGPDSRRGEHQQCPGPLPHFLKGRTLMDERISLGPAGLREALGHFNEAIELDPRFDRAHVGMASIYYLLPAYDASLDVAAYLELAEASARYALELNPASSESLGVLAAIMFRRGEPAQAAALFERTRELGNTDPNILHWDALLFTSMGYFESLVPRLEDAYRLDPLNPLLGCSLGGALNLSGAPRGVGGRVQQRETVFTPRRWAGHGQHVPGRFRHCPARCSRDVELWTGVLPAHYSDMVVTAFEDPVRYHSVENGPGVRGLGR